MVKPFTYKDSGVDIDAGNELVNRIKNIAQKTNRKGLLSGIGGFSALFEIPWENYENPVLVSSTDGVGTKLCLAHTLNQPDNIGIDLVAMCVNDLLVVGAEPLFFLDYFATGHLEVDIAERVIKSIAKGLELANTSLVGGETAEMPGLYKEGTYDLAGFAVGVVEKANILDGKNIKEGDCLIGLASSGFHSNGFSLIRHIITEQKLDLHKPVENSFENKVEIGLENKLVVKTLGEELLTPTRIYVQTLLPLIKQKMLKGMVHITGGGFIDNIPRILPQNLAAQIDLSSWKMPAIFGFFQKQGNIEWMEMLRTFNCGVGMVLIVSREQVTEVLNYLNNLNEKAWVMGSIQAKPHTHDPAVVFENQFENKLGCQ